MSIRFIIPFVTILAIIFSKIAFYAFFCNIS